MNALLAYRPFLDPLDIHAQWWITVIPLALGIAWTYKAVRVHTFDNFFKHVGIMTVQIVAAMVALSAGLYLLVELIIPLLD